MFVLSFKTGGKKFFFIAAAVIIIFAIVITAVSLSSEKSYLVMANQKYSLKAETNDERIGFLQQFGWTVNAEPIEISEVTIPQTFNEVYEKYNEIQKQQGMDLTRYAGKICKQWVYQVTNFPEYQDSIRATLLVLDGKVIGGDISSTELNGYMYPFTAIKDGLSEFPQTDSSTAETPVQSQESAQSQEADGIAQSTGTDTAVSTTTIPAESSEIPANAWPTD